MNELFQKAERQICKDSRIPRQLLSLTSEDMNLK